MRTPIALAALLVCVVCVSYGQTPDGAASVVHVPVTVTDSLNRVVTDLDQNAFRVYEDQVEQKVSVERESGPLSIGIVLDTSGSMDGALEKSRLAVADFFKSAGNGPEDEAFLIEFSDRPVVAQSFTHDLQSIENRLAAIEPNGKSALFDAVYLGLNEMKKAKNPRKVMILISDGENAGSRYSGAEVAKLEKESDVQVYAIAIVNGNDSPRTGEGLTAVGTLRQLSEPTGGQCFVVGNPGELPDMGAKVATEVGSQYWVTYRSANPARDGKFRRITVRLNPPNGYPALRAFSISGYYAPTQ